MVVHPASSDLWTSASLAHLCANPVSIVFDSCMWGAAARVRQRALSNADFLPQFALTCNHKEPHSRPSVAS
eukprot:6031983-Amphidinium_carterae.1